MQRRVVKQAKSYRCDSVMLQLNRFYTEQRPMMFAFDNARFVAPEGSRADQFVWTTSSRTNVWFIGDLVEAMLAKELNNAERSN